MLNITGNKLLKFCGNLLWLLCGSLLVLNCTFCVRHIKRSKMKLIHFCFVFYGSSHCQVAWVAMLSAVLSKSLSQVFEFIFEKCLLLGL